ncbi:MAG: hydantoinase/oxoprolinase family protein [Paracoccaceae bacterium]
MIGAAKSLTTRPDLALGIGRAIDAALAEANLKSDKIAMVSLSTTLATNALVEGQGGRVALIFIGFDSSDSERAGLDQALGTDPVVILTGGHSHSGTELCPLDLEALETQVRAIAPEVMGFAVAARFATRNPAHEIITRDLIRRVTGRPVTCSHELSANLNGPKRALTAVLNARLVGMIDRLVSACEDHLKQIGIKAPLMVVRGDGALISVAVVRERPIETILSGPAASIVGARWLTGAQNALVSDIGGTTTDIAILRDGLPEIDPEGAQVGGFRTMVEAVAVRTTGLGGDSEVHLIIEGIECGLQLGPRRLIPISLIAVSYPKMVHDELDRALSTEVMGEFDGKFVVPMSGQTGGLSPRETDLLARIERPMPLAAALSSRIEVAAMERLVVRGLVVICGVTPSDASHMLGRLAAWDGVAAEKALRLLGRKRNGNGERFSNDPMILALKIIDQLTAQTVDCLLEAAFAEDGEFERHSPAQLARHILTKKGLNQHKGIFEINARLGVAVIGLGASAASYYQDVGKVLGCQIIFPEHAGVANAIGAVVGQISQKVSGLVFGLSESRFAAHLPAGIEIFSNLDKAFEAMNQALESEAGARAIRAGVEEFTLTQSRDRREAMIEGKMMFVEATLSVTASGRPRIVPSGN